MSDTLHIQVYDFDHKVFEGEVSAMSSVNEIGPYDILPSHSHFISLLQGKLVLHHTTGSSQTFDILHGVVRCFDDQVHVYIATVSAG